MDTHIVDTCEGECKDIGVCAGIHAQMFIHRNVSMRTQVCSITSTPVEAGGRSYRRTHSL